MSLCESFRVPGQSAPPYESGGLGPAIACRLARDGAAVLVHYGSSRREAEAVVRDILGSAGVTVNNVQPAVVQPEP